MRPRSATMLFGAFIVAAALTACGSDSDNDSSGSGMDMGDSGMSTSVDGAQVDITFAQLMIAHHQQAVEMADLALKYAKSQDVTALADQIKAAQGPEIDQMTQWLNNWGAPTEMPADEHDMGGMSMSGMMTSQDMTGLAKARGADFDRMWLQMMISHHQGAIQMAQEALAQSSNEDVTMLAQAIVDSQTAELQHMQQLLTS